MAHISTIKMEVKWDIISTPYRSERGYRWVKPAWRWKGAIVILHLPHLWKCSQLRNIREVRSLMTGVKNHLGAKLSEVTALATTSPICYFSSMSQSCLLSPLLFLLSTISSNSASVSPYRTCLSSETQMTLEFNKLSAKGVSQTLHILMQNA